MSEVRETADLPDEQDEFEPDESAEEQEDEGESQDAEPEPEEPSEDEEPERQPRQTQRRAGRRERQSAELRELRERSDRLERELQAVRQQPQQRVDNSAELARVAAWEREQLPLQAIDQQIAYWRQKDRQEIHAALVGQQQATNDTIDRTSFEARCAADPVRARFARQVESMLAEYVPGQVRPPRDVVFKFLLGQEADRQRGRNAGQRAAGQRRVRSQQTRPAGAGSDTPRRRDAPAADSYEASLERVRNKALW